MDRIKKLSLQILEQYKAKFGTNFMDNKKMLDSLSTVRSKGLKNKIAGFITKFIKQEIKQIESKQEQVAQAEKEIQESTNKDNEKAIASQNDNDDKNNNDNIDTTDAINEKSPSQAIQSEEPETTDDALKEQQTPPPPPTTNDKEQDSN